MAVVDRKFQGFENIKLFDGQLQGADNEVEETMETENFVAVETEVEALSEDGVELSGKKVEQGRKMIRH